jgi:hypothetical protein
MAARLTDLEIAHLIGEEKRLPEDYLSRLELKSKKGHKEKEINVRGANGSNFIIILRQSLLNPLDLSVILGYQIPNSNVVFRLRRYNGKSHQHVNKIEGEEFYDFHIHFATERYQTFGMEEDSYAHSTDKYSDFHKAVDCLFAECGFISPSGSQMNLF